MSALRRRVMPCLLLDGEGLVKTVNFKSATYIGDPINAIRIFNELEVDELILLDIMASDKDMRPDFEIINKVASECFMPLTYGGGIKSVGDADNLFRIGIEKISLNSALFEQAELLPQISQKYGSQAVVASIDVLKNMFGKYHVYRERGRKKTNESPLNWALKLQELGAGEILLTSINHEGTWDGFDLKLIEELASALSIPVIANGGAGNAEDLRSALKQGNDSEVTAGSMFVFQKKGMGVLINYPPQNIIEQIIAK